MNSLLGLRNYIRKQHQATLADLQRQFDGSAQMLDALLDELEVRGKIIKSDTAVGSCSQKTCKGCVEGQSDVLYRWYEAELAVCLVS
ncbi:FeoC-like transcriptional regulator [Vibrio sp. S4M6]|uniref:FeoC-like transcriptional regulator n=1 Tax=Vibrio sinus TaxID=2946865 RepID=UPI002029D147|nr:FeoC-like transcriptional regulator [Vibrio sinus]MCL9781849.1 FeoC-like transcriptional regulator [Vibrio sinus]